MVQYTNGRHKATVGMDFTGVPSPLANASGGVANAVTVFSELDTVRQNLEALLNQQVTALQQADTTDTANWEAALSQANTAINNAIQGVRSEVTVAARVETLPAAPVAVSAIPGLTAVTDPTDWHGWFLYDGGGTAQDGVYYLVSGTPTKANVTIHGGSLIYVDAGTYQNSFWRTIHDPDPTTGAIAVQPFGRVQDLGIASGTFLTLAANTLNASLDGDFFAVASGALTFSAAFKSAIAALQSASTQAATDITAIKAKDTQYEGDITTLQSAATSTSGALTTLGAQISAIQAKDTSQDGLITGLRTDLTTTQGDVTTLQTGATAQGSAITAIQAKDTAQDGLITGLRTDVTAAQGNITDLQTSDASQGTAITAIQAKDTAQDGLITGLRTDVTAAQGNITSLQSDVTTANGALAAIQTKDTSQDGLITGLRTDVTAAQGNITTLQTDSATASAAITAIQAVDTTQDSAIAALQATAATVQTSQQVQDAILAAYKVNHKILSLTGGVSSADGSFTKTVFTLSTGFNTLDFALVQLSEAAAPYQEVARPQVERSSTDSLQLTLWSNSGAVPDSAIEAFVQRYYRGN